MTARTFTAQTDLSPFQPLHPGDHLAEYLELNRLTVPAFGNCLGVCADYLQLLVGRQDALTPTMARLLGLATGMESADWLELQYMWDGWQLRNQNLMSAAVNGPNKVDEPSSHL